MLREHSVTGVIGVELDVSLSLSLSVALVGWGSVGDGGWVDLRFTRCGC